MGEILVFMGDVVCWCGGDWWCGLVSFVCGCLGGVLCLVWGDCGW